MLTVFASSIILFVPLIQMRLITHINVYVLQAVRGKTIWTNEDMWTKVKHLLWCTTKSAYLNHVHVAIKATRLAVHHILQVLAFVCVRSCMKSCREKHKHPHHNPFFDSLIEMVYGNRAETHGEGSSHIWSIAYRKVYGRSAGFVLSELIWHLGHQCWACTQEEGCLGVAAQ